MASLVCRPGNPVYYIQFYVGGKARRVSTQTAVLKVAQEKLRQFESAQWRGEDSPLPTNTPISELVGAYVRHIRTTKTPKSVQTDIYYLRDLFGIICPELESASRKLTTKAKKRPRKALDLDRRRRALVLEADGIEKITTADISAFISTQVQTRGIKPKTANRYREILSTLFNWAMRERGVRMPRDLNPTTKVQRYKEAAPTIRFLTLPQIQEQLEALKENLQMQVMVATLIYAGLRREELLWLTPQDINWTAGVYGMLYIRAKTIDGIFWQPKTKKNRNVPISAALRQYLNQWKLQGADGTWVFPSPTGCLWDPDNFSQDLRAANQKAKLVWGSLDYRHTFGSHLAMKGESLYKIAKLMGNSPQIAEKHYAHLLPESLVASVEFSEPTVPPADLVQQQKEPSPQIRGLGSSACW